VTTASTTMETATTTMETATTAVKTSTAKAVAATETAAAEVAAPTEARASVPGEAMHVAAMIKTAESARVHAGYRGRSSMKGGSAAMKVLCSVVEITAAMEGIPTMEVISPMESVPTMEAISTMKAAVVEACTLVIEPVAVHKGSAVRYELVVVKINSVVVPVRRPVVPSPAIPTKEADTETRAKEESRATNE
jgi:hypothetical protein